MEAAPTGDAVQRLRASSNIRTRASPRVPSRCYHPLRPRLPRSYSRRERRERMLPLTPSASPLSGRRVRQLGACRTSALQPPQSPRSLPFCNAAEPLGCDLSAVYNLSACEGDGCRRFSSLTWLPWPGERASSAKHARRVSDRPRSTTASLPVPTCRRSVCVFSCTTQSEGHMPARPESSKRFGCGRVESHQSACMHAARWRFCGPPSPHLA